MHLAPTRNIYHLFFRLLGFAGSAVRAKERGKIMTMPKSDERPSRAGRGEYTPQVARTMLHNANWRGMPPRPAPRYLLVALRRGTSGGARSWCTAQHRVSGALRSTCKLGVAVPWRCPGRALAAAGVLFTLPHRGLAGLGLRSRLLSLLTASGRGMAALAALSVLAAAMITPSTSAAFVVHNGGALGIVWESVGRMTVSLGGIGNRFCL